MGRIRVRRHLSDFGLLQWWLDDTTLVTTTAEVLAYLAEHGATADDLRFASSADRTAFADTFPTPTS